MGIETASDAASRADGGATLFHFPPQSVRLSVRKHKGSEEIDQISLQNLLQSKCRSLFTNFRPVWWLFNGHLQTLYNVAGEFVNSNGLWYRRQLIRLLDGGTIGLDFAPADSSMLADDAPIVVTQHGLTGGSHEPYLRAIVAPVCTPVEKGGLGYRVVVVTFRGCAGVPLTSPRLYTAGDTDDLHQALMYIAHRYPRAPLLGLGFSLGANVITRYAAQTGEQSRLSSAFVLGCPWNLLNNGYALVSTFLGKNVWARGMGRNFLNLVRRHAAILREDPQLPVAKVLSSTLTLRYPTLRHFDDVFTRNVGGAPPLFPFPTVDQYYSWASSHDVVGDIKIPYLAINAEDDPVVNLSPMDGAGNPNVVMALTRYGGHLGWYRAGSGSGLERWTTKPAMEWLRLMGEEVVHKESMAPPMYVDEDGFIREVGRDDLGCKEIEGGGMIDGSAGDPGLLRGL